MIAVDTNVIVRLIVDDDPEQVQAARALAARETFFLSLTVLIETEWVLRSTYKYLRPNIHSALTELFRLINVCFDNADDVRWALDRYASGGELADYLHIAAARGVGRFATFEKGLATRAGDGAPAQVETLT